jgi:hypothetical protein
MSTITKKFPIIEENNLREIKIIKKFSKGSTFEKYPQLEKYKTLEENSLLRNLKISRYIIICIDFISAIINIFVVLSLFFEYFHSSEYTNDDDTTWDNMRIACIILSFFVDCGIIWRQFQKYSQERVKFLLNLATKGIFILI